jgi:hypothetical protein
MNKMVSWRSTGTVNCYFVFVLVRLYHTTSTTNHASAERINPTVIH